MSLLLFCVKRPDEEVLCHVLVVVLCTEAR